MVEIKTSDFKKEVLVILEQLSKALEVEPAVILENIFIKRVARDHAEGAVCGKMSHLMTEFAKAKDTGQVRRGQELYNVMYAEAAREFEQGELYRIENKLKYIEYEQLLEHEQEILKKHGQDPESRAAKKEEKEKAEKEIQSYIDSGDLIVDEVYTGNKSIYEP